MTRSRGAAFGGVAWLFLACGGNNTGDVTPDAPPPEEEMDTGIACEYDSECSDGAFCNGEEVCFEGTCHTGEPPTCDDGIECTTDSCSHAANNCVFSAPDEDGDGHFDAACLGPDGEVLGDDCDDNDNNRFPGNTEVCDEDPTHDEDCDPQTFGFLDADVDGVVSDQCCNQGDEEMFCGTDCDDQDYRKYPMHPEICDDLDNDCDGQVDVNTKEVPWFPDEDGDNFGLMTGSPIESCAPIDGYSLRPTDCDDTTAAIHSAATETCDGFDNDCDGDVDEDNVCACAPEGNARPCACDSTTTGIQICAGGLWGECNCDECIDGEMDCIAGILPRLCVDGRWEFQHACTGQFSECNDGICTCPGGGTDCPAPVGGTGGAMGTGGAGVGGSGGIGGNGAGVAPVQTGSNPPPGMVAFDENSDITVTFDSDIQESGVAGALSLRDAYNNLVAGDIFVNGNVITFDPFSALETGMEYFLNIDNSIMDVDGDILGTAVNLHFSTPTGVTPIQVSQTVGVHYSAPHLALSPDGSWRYLLAKETIGVTDKTILLGWDGSNWSGAEEVEANWPVSWAVDVDGSGNVVAIAYDGANLGRYQRISNVWSGPASFASANGDTAPNLVTLNTAGRGFYVYEDDTSTLTLTGRVAAGTYDTSITQALGGDSNRSADINATGAAAVGLISGMRQMVWHTADNLATPTFTTLENNVNFQDAAISNNGIIAAAYSKNLGSGTPPDQVRVRIFNGTWGSEIDVITGSVGGDELEVAVGINSTDDTHVIFRKGPNLESAILFGGGSVFQGSEVINPPTMSSIGMVRTAFANNGDAFAVWIQSTGDGSMGESLWGAHYQSGTGWEPARLLEDSAGSIGLFDLAVDDSGNAYLVFEQMVVDTPELYTLTLP